MKDKLKKLYIILVTLIGFFTIPPVYAIDKIEGGDVTIDKLGTIIKGKL